MKILKLLFFVLFAFLLNSCNNHQNKEHTIKVGATPLPHAQILESIKPELQKLGYELKIVSYVDYVTPNEALKDGSLDANFFQHAPFLQAFNTAKNTNLVSVGTIHIEPLSIYSHQIKNLDSLQENDTILIPNDPSNLARALILLDHLKLIALKDPNNLNATMQEITNNPKNLKIIPIEAAMLAKNIDDKKVKAIVINGNYALQNHLQNPIAQEDGRSPYANVIATQEKNKNSPKIQALMQALHSQKTKDFITQTYQGSVIPAF